MCFLALDGFHEHWSRNDGSYFLICLLGKMKGENSERSHLTSCNNTPATKINVKAIFQRLINLKKGQGFIQGPAVSYCNEYPIPISEFDDIMVDI